MLSAVQKKLPMGTAVWLLTAAIVLASGLDSSCCAEDLESSRSEDGGNESLPSATTSPDCPPWFLPLSIATPSDHVLPPLCHCADTLRSIVQCDNMNQSSLLSLTHCMTFEERSSELLVGACVYHYIPKNISGFWIPLPRNVSLINEHLCGRLHRRGLLCGRCEEGYGVSLHTNDLECAECGERPGGWGWFVLSEIVLQMLFILGIFFLKITVNTEKLNGFLFFCQLVSFTTVDRILPNFAAGVGRKPLKRFSMFLIVFYKFWILQFFTSIFPRACAQEGLSTLTAVALGYVSAFFPFVFITFVFVVVRLRDCNFKPVAVVWQPYQRVKRKLKAYVDLNLSLIHTFSSILVLSYSKLILVSLSLLFPVDVFDSSGNTAFNSSRWLYDAEIEIFGSEHTPYGILAILVLLTFGVAPPLLLFAYPFRRFRWLLHRARLDHHGLNTFMDSFQGYYKNGTGGSRDLRCFSALYFVLRLAFVAIRLCVEYDWQWQISILILVAATIVFGYFRPYRRELYNVVDIVFLSLLAGVFYFYTFIKANVFDEQIPTRVVILVTVLALCPVVYFVSFMIYHLVKSIKATQKWKRWISGLRRRGRKDGANLMDMEWPYQLAEEESSV